MTYDQICLKNFHLSCIIGLAPEERVEKQDVILDVTLFTDFKNCIVNDDIAQTVDYSKLRQSVRSIVEESSFQLIESLAEHVAKVCLGFERVHKVDVSIDKPGAMRGTGSVCVKISRSKV